MSSTSRQNPTEADGQMLQRRAIFTRQILPHQKDLTRSARTLCSGDEDRVQDLVQDSLIRAYTACLAGHFREDSNPRAWLLRIVTNLYINDYNHRRRWQAKAALDSPAADKALATLSQRAALRGTPAALVLAAVLDEELERALAELPEGLRLCMLLVDVEGLEYEVAAQHLGIPVGTVRSRLSRARRRMQVLLQESDKTFGD